MVGFFVGGVFYYFLLTVQEEADAGETKRVRAQTVGLPGVRNLPSPGETRELKPSAGMRLWTSLQEYARPSLESAAMWAGVASVPGLNFSPSLPLHQATGSLAGLPPRSPTCPSSQRPRLSSRPTGEMKRLLEQAVSKQGIPSQRWPILECIL
ncbi:hypothetical protein UPYG_G00034180 [Umbra pygmaea]|uniref:Uncharacterized protein n=1 Tax=Umbra pygmaea TaxID=75934 RepID=A0ABD0XRC1_UMBPY